MLWLPCVGPAMPQIVSSWISGGLVLVMASSSGVLVAPAPGGPVQPVAGVPCGLGDQGSGQAGDLVAGQRDQPDWRWLGVLGQRGDGEEGAGDHGQGDPPVPGDPAPHLVLIQGGQAVAGLEILLTSPTKVPSGVTAA
jgi:hypothetical protein